MTHIPLKMILRNTSLLTPEEQKFALNYKTHIDFLIFSKIDKQPKLAIEVDGVSFHKTGSLQHKRDQLKENIFKKYHIKFLRLRTNGSGERKNY